MTEPLTLTRGGWRYLIPNALTATNLMLGTVACFLAVQGDVYLSGWLILLAGCFDRFDGAAARALHATGKFGIEFDSLADLTSFGIAPAVFLWAGLSGLDVYQDGPARIALYAVCATYALAIAFRLARFNVFADAAGSKIYFGLPSPIGAALVVATFLLVAKYSDAPGLYREWAADLRVLGGLELPRAFLEYYPLVVLATAYGLVCSLKVPKMGRPKTRAGALYFAGTLGLMYVAVVGRLLPEYLVFVGLQVLGMALVFHFFNPTARDARPQAFFEALSMSDEPAPAPPAATGPGPAK
jgi:CDP-diacylglycerol--serine O-phosphatidyltransferase